MAATETQSGKANPTESFRVLVDRTATGAAKDLEKGLTIEALSSEIEEPRKTEAEKVSWDGPKDPENPQNWPFRQKFIIVAIVSTITFIRYGKVSRFLHAS